MLKKIRTITLFVFIILIPKPLLGFADDSISVTQSLPLYRLEKPFALKLGVDGFGCEYTYNTLRLNLEIGSFIFIQGYRIKYFYSDNNSTPFIGFGSGESGVGGDGGNHWSIIFIGWQHHFKNVFFDISYQYVQKEINKNSKTPSIIGVSLGIRLF